jgi:hypothetical protein
MNKRLHFILPALFLCLLTACAGGRSVVKIKLMANESVGDNYVSEISPDCTVVRELSHKYTVYLPFPGMHGRYKFKFKAVAEGEAEIMICNYFRDRKPALVVAVYKATVDKKKRLTLTERDIPDAMAEK